MRRATSSLVVLVVVAWAAGCGTPPAATNQTSVPPPPPATAPPVASSSSAPPIVASYEPLKDAGAAMNMTPAKTDTPATFDEDLTFMQKHGKVLVLSDADGGKIALSAQYQGRVMTSAVASAGRSLGWINRDFIAGGKTGTQFDNYGGEDRFWLGPEAGQFGLYFPPGGKFTFDLWQTPHPMQEGAWDVSDEKADHVTFKKQMTVTNWSKVDFTVDVERTAKLLSKADATKVLGLAGVTLPKTVGFVAYETKNKITNRGKAAWTKDKGLLSVWILAMFAPASDGRVVIPFEVGANKGELVNDRYFGKVPADRLRVKEEKDRGYLTFTTDGKERGKIGLSPQRAKSVLGSYSAEAKLLTIVHYDGPKKGAPYVNSMWEEQKEPYKGDTINSYNDGPPAPGKPPLGGFYEIETSSPAADLAPGKDLVHTHRTFHFVGEPADLDPIAKKALGVSIAEITAK